MNPPESGGLCAALILVRGFFALEGALLGALPVAGIAAAVWGSSGPAWPFAPLGVLAALGAFGGWRFSRVISDRPAARRSK